MITCLEVLSFDLQRRTNLHSILFLALMYATFISLGLPDSILGASWPVMQPDLGVPYSYAGIASMVIAGGTIIASFFGGQLIQRMGTGNLTRVSVAMTAIALFGLSQTRSFAWVLMMAIPLGLGAGAVDAALNHFVATHYKAHHMNWLHCFWGVGAMAGPLIMARFIAAGGQWRGGYLTISFIQGLLVAVLIASIPLWRRFEHLNPNPAGTGRSGEVDLSTQQRSGGVAPSAPMVQESERQPRTTQSIVPYLPHVWPLLLSFLLYSGIEATVGLWGSSFLVRARGFDVAGAAFGVSLFFGSLTVGRIIAGFVSMKMSDAWLVRTGLFIVVVGAGTLVVSSSKAFSMLGLAVVGLGCAPIYPAMLHQTPERFGTTLAPVLMGMQMAVAYTGSTLLPPAFGLVSAGKHLWLLPLALLLYAVVMLGCTETMNRRGLALQESLLK